LDFWPAGAGGGGDSDLARATGIALQIEASFGLGTLGLIYIDDEPDKRDLLLIHNLREAVARSLERAHSAALDLLKQNRAALDALAGALFAKGYLDRAEIAAIFEQTPICANTVTRSPGVFASADEPTLIERTDDRGAALAQTPGSDDDGHWALNPTDPGGPQ